ncbi:sporulation protein YqfD [Clostridium faecium]|nr:sporulation protein YqfD [Clostridium faecium]
MEKMNNIKKYGNGILTIEVQSLKPEKFINFLWRNNVVIKNVKRRSLTNYTMKINLQDYNTVLEGAARTNSKVTVLKRKGSIFKILKLRRRKTLVITLALFVGVLYYLSSFIWKVEIITDKYLSPFEIRMQLKSYGIDKGTFKKDFDVYKLEEKIIEDNDEVMWVKARIEGSKLTVQVAERQAPPKIREHKTTGNIVASKDGEVDRIFSITGTSVVEPGKIVKRGDLLIKSEQGKEGKEYNIKAEGTVYAKTFYEKNKEVPKYTIKRERTGNVSKSYYVKFKDKKLYIRNGLNDFENYDKIDNNKGIIKTETYHEVVEEKVPTEVDEVIKELNRNIILNLDKSVKILEVIPEIKEMEDKFLVNLLVIAEENIATEEFVDGEEALD